MVMVCTRLPLVATIVIGTFAVAADFDALIVRSEPPLTSDGELKDALTPDGIPAADRLTVP
jgi:hypothetical protein